MARSTASRRACADQVVEAEHAVAQFRGVVALLEGVLEPAAPWRERRLRWRLNRTCPIWICTRVLLAVPSSQCLGCMRGRSSVLARLEGGALENGGEAAMGGAVW